MHTIILFFFFFIFQDEKDGVEMSEDFEGKLHSGEGTEENSDDENETEEPEDLDKQMGEVESEEAEKLDDKVLFLFLTLKS